MEGVLDAAVAFSCPIVGGDVTSSPVAMVDVAVTGLVPRGGAMRRSGIEVGDQLFVTGVLGASAAGLRQLQAGAGGDTVATGAHRRPVPRLAAGSAAREAGVRAAMDLSDGLGVDLDRMARASGVGIELDLVPVAPGATEADALGGGEDYELVLATSTPGRLLAAFEQAGLTVPIAIGVAVEDESRRTLSGEPLDAAGWRHDVA